MHFVKSLNNDSIGSCCKVVGYLAFTMNRKISKAINFIVALSGFEFITNNLWYIMRWLHVN